MASGSARSRAELFDEVEKTIDAASASRLGEELFAVVGVLDHEATLRRALTEPAVPTQIKEQMVESLLGGKVGKSAVEVMKSAVAKRWSRSVDFANALEEVGVIAIASDAEQAGRLDGVEDELFRFGRILDAEPQLREALADGAAPLEGKRALLHDLLGRKVSKVTRELLDQLVVGRHRTLARGLAHYQSVLAARHESLLATAWVATALSDDQKDRMTKALSAMYDRPVHLNVVIDPDVLGGVRVMVGDDLIDSSIETRLADAHRRLIS
jgi:F-type H+-transporting ATPase subunit delta